jgi:KipI family sensor histidine kinase inhibitor
MDSAVAFAQLQKLQRNFERNAPGGLRELTPGFATLLLEFEPGRRPSPVELGQRLAEMQPAEEVGLAEPATVRIPVKYAGIDLQRVASHAGLTASEVIELHAASEYTVQLLGFAPGFPYLRGLDSRLVTPRHDAPRPRVDAGSVAIGGEHAGVYPIATAGGWNLLGSTPLRLFDPSLPDPFLLKPGMRVRFEPI